MAPASTLERPVRTVVLVMAMEQEAEPFIQKHNLKLEVSPSPFVPGTPFKAFGGVVGGVAVHLIWTGRDARYNVNNVATTAAAVAVYAAVAFYKEVDLVISAGTAGGFTSVGARIGDVYLSSKW